MGGRRAGAAWPQRALRPGRRWFHGKISGHEAVQQLQPPEDGLFLVRESARHPGDYVLCVSFGRDVIHYRVLHRDGHLTIDEAVCFCNLMDMVEVWLPQAPPPSGPGTPPLRPAPEPHGLHRGAGGTCTPQPPPPDSGNCWARDTQSCLLSPSAGRSGCSPQTTSPAAGLGLRVHL